MPKPFGFRVSSGCDSARDLFYEDMTAHIRTLIEEHGLVADTVEFNAEFVRLENNIGTVSNLDLRLVAVLVQHLRNELKHYYPEVKSLKLLYEKGALSILEFET